MALKTYNWTGRIISMLSAERTVPENTTLLKAMYSLIKPLNCKMVENLTKEMEEQIL